jgi:hypothetical protein
MNPIPPRKVVKQLIFFAKREFKEKKPLSAEVLRVKGEHYLTKSGPLKEFSISRVVGAFYLVLVEYKESGRIYYYSKEGILLGAQNFDKETRALNDIRKSTIREFHVGKN